MNLSLSKKITFSLNAWESVYKNGFRAEGLTRELAHRAPSQWRDVDFLHWFSLFLFPYSLAMFGQTLFFFFATTCHKKTSHARVPPQRSVKNRVLSRLLVVVVVVVGDWIFFCFCFCFPGFLQKGKPDVMPHRITPKEEGRKTRELGKKIEMRVKKKELLQPRSLLCRPRW